RTYHQVRRATGVESSALGRKIQREIRVARRSCRHEARKHTRCAASRREVGLAAASGREIKSARSSHVRASAKYHIPQARIDQHGIGRVRKLTHVITMRVEGVDRSIAKISHQNIVRKCPEARRGLYHAPRSVEMVWSLRIIGDK